MSEWMGMMTPADMTLEELLFSRKPGSVEYGKQIVRQIAQKAQRDGELVPQPCEVCGVEKVEKHHDDYTKPLQVRWLCQRDHLAVHGRRKQP